MKKTLPFVMVLTSTILLAQQNTFNKVYYEFSGIETESRSVAKTFDGGYLIAGKAGNHMGYLLKTDSNGDELWNKFFDHLPLDYVEFNRIIPTTDSCFVIGGNVQTNQQSAVMVIKVNAAGDTLWTKTFSRAGEALYCYNITQTLDGGYILTGSSSFGGSPPYSKLLMLKTDFNGNLEWMQIMQGNNFYNTGYSVKQDTDSNYVVTGYLEEQTGPPGFEIGMMLAKFSANGTPIWAKKYYSNLNTPVWGYDFEITDSGYMCYLNYSNFDAVLKADLTGNIISGSRFNVSNPAAINQPMPKIKNTNDGGFVFIAGSCFGPNILYKTDSTGALQWSEQLFLNAAEVVESDNKELFVAGSGPLCGIRTAQVLWPQIGIMQTDSTGNIPGTACIYFLPDTAFPVTLTTGNVTFTITTGGTQGSYQTTLGPLSLTNYSGCVDFWGGIQEEPINRISIAPNPASSYIEVTLPYMVSNPVVVICDMYGKIIQKETVSSHGKRILNIDIRNLKEGMNIVSINCGKEIIKKRFIKI